MKKLFTAYNIKKFLLLNLGLIITAAGISIFKTPNHFALGGTSGISIILSYLVPNINVGMAMFIVNILLTLVGLAFLGKQVVGLTLYSGLALSAYVSIIGYILPLSAPLTNDTLLELIFAVSLPAVGSAIVFNTGASTGGSDIVAMILAKYVKLEIGKAMLFTDALVTLTAACIFGVKVGLYCVLGLFLKTFLIDSVIESFNMRKLLTIISEKPEDIKHFIVKKLNRGATVSVAYGAYSNEEKQVITTVLSHRQAITLRNYIRSIDKNAFISIVNTSETVGNGFRAL